MGKESEFWFCFVGPAEYNKIPMGGDAPLRSAVKERYIDMFDEHPEIISSGWGLTERKKQLIQVLMGLDEEILETIVHAVKTF